ncbi:response regulator transcription factor [Roseivirga sp. BDSF3-8]|uniref:response regulator transcription factor n=1 Tax=Roseivirga sp. BDSF3-8 TaxID=3241598 RepID=UPI00353223B8
MKPKILIVDDEPNILLSLEFLMKKNGYEVFIARDGSEALDILSQQTPEVILLDIMMPEVDGYEVCQQVKANPLMKDSKVIFLSAKSKESDISKGYDAGADLYMTKPFSTRELMSKVKELTPIKKT